MGLQLLRVGCPASVISDMDAPMRRLCGHTMPDGPVGIFTGNYDGHVAGCHYVDFCTVFMLTCWVGQKNSTYISDVIQGWFLI